MHTAQMGDRVTVQYTKRFEDGSRASSRSAVELTVGVEHPRLPGLGLALVGAAEGATKTIEVPVEQAYGPCDPKRVRRCPRSRFPADQALVIGKWARISKSSGKPSFVRILKMNDKMVVVDTNRRGAGQAMLLEVRLLHIAKASV